MLRQHQCCTKENSSVGLKRSADAIQLDMLVNGHGTKSHIKKTQSV